MSPVENSSGRDAGDPGVARASTGDLMIPPACADPVLARLEQLLDDRVMTRSPAALLSLVDALEGHVDHGCEGLESLLLAVRLLHAAAEARGSGEHGRALEFLDTGADLLRACLLPCVNGGSL